MHLGDDPHLGWLLRLELGDDRAWLLEQLRQRRPRLAAAVELGVLSRHGYRLDERGAGSIADRMAKLTGGVRERLGLGSPHIF